MQKAIVTTYVSIDGGLRAQSVVIAAIEMAFARYTSIRCAATQQRSAECRYEPWQTSACRSDLLGKVVPEPSDVQIEDFDSLSTFQLGSVRWHVMPPRSLADCSRW